MKVSFKSLIYSFVLCPSLLFPQSTTNFNIESYKLFLTTHQNMDAEQLMQMHDAGSFEDNINADYSSANYFDSIEAKYNITNYEKSLISKNGFMVSERMSYNSFGEAFLNIYHKDLPVYVSTDAILHAFHVSYDRILKDMELAVLIDKLTTLLEQLHSQMPQLESKYSSYPEMNQMLRDVDVYLTVARKLLDENVSPYYTGNVDKINHLYNRAIEADGFNTDTLFANACVRVDWSQFKPRGHYVDELHPILENYFRTMMWLGRIEIYLLPPNAYPDPPCVVQNFEDAKRQIIDSYLITELFDLSDTWQLYKDFETIIKFFVGDQDNVTLDHLLYLKDKISLSNASDLLDSLKLVEFQDTLKKQSFANQLILSQILISNDVGSPDSIKPASSFMMFGQRFVIDSYVTGSVVYDRIKYNDQVICRLYPSALDPMFALGNDAAGQLLKTELEQYHYSSNLAALRYLINSYGTEFWDNTIYNMWLNSIRKLNPPSVRNSLPKFMQTAAFWQEKLNTQLSSWAQLRHDNLLYAKQSYTGGAICSFPYSYVEPFPEFYQSLKHFAELAKIKFQTLPFENDWQKNIIIDYLNNFEPIMDTLSNISLKILNNEAFTEKENLFLQTMLYDHISQMCGDSPYDGWYTKLFYRDEAYSHSGLIEGENIVADIHTTPTDCGGGVIGAVTHVGTGPINLGVFIAQIPNGQKTAFVGPCLSYFEYVTKNFLRLTDEEWKQQYMHSAMRPSWTNIYLADSSGGSRGQGLQLVTSVEKDGNKIIPESHLVAQNYPNPFNPSTIISFSIPFDLTNSLAELIVYNIQGEVVKRLVREILPAGNYLAKWDGTNEIGAKVSSGIYIYNLMVANKQFSGKMALMK